jgi:hypothetical protein
MGYPEKNFLPRRFITQAREGLNPLCGLTVPPSQNIFLSLNFVVMTRGLLPAQNQRESRENLNWLTNLF